MRILIVNNSLDVGGIESVILQQCKIFKKQNICVGVVCVSQNGQVGKILKEMNINILDLSYLEKRDKTRLLVRHIRTFRPDFILLHNASISKSVQRTKDPIRYKLIHQIHTDLNNAPTIEDYEWIDGIVSTHPIMLMKAKEIYQDKKHFMLINPIDEHFFNDQSIDTDNIVLGYCGRIAVEKSLISFAHVCDAVNKKLKNVSALIIGDSAAFSRKCKKYKKEVVDEFERLNIPLKITGFVPECSSLMREMTVGVLLSDKEGSGNFIWEACSQGIPFVSAEVGSSYLILDKANIVPADCDLVRVASEKIIDNINNRRDYRSRAYLAHPSVYEDQFIGLLNSFG